MKELNWKTILSIAILIYAVSFGFQVYSNYQSKKETLRHTEFEECITALKIYQQDDSLFKDLFKTYKGPKSLDDCYGK